MHFELVRDDLPVRVEPAAVIETNVVPSRIPGLVDEDTLFAPFVVDVEGQFHSGRPVAFFGLLREGGWEPDDTLSDPLTRLGMTFVPRPRSRNDDLAGSVRVRPPGRRAVGRRQARRVLDLEDRFRTRRRTTDIRRGRP